MNKSLAFAAACLIAVASTNAGAATLQLPGQDGGACVASLPAAPISPLFGAQRAACGRVCAPNLYNSGALTGYGGSCTDAYNDLIAKSNAYLSANATTTCHTNEGSGACAETTVVTSGCALTIGGYYAYVGHANFGCMESSC